MLDVSECTRNPGTQYAFDEEQAIAPQTVYGDELVFDPARLRGSFVSDDDGNVTVDGKLNVVVHGHCANCLSETQCMVEADFRETFLREGDPEDDEIFTYQGYRISLEKLALSYAMLNLPLRMLCREDCVGLLAYAGDGKEQKRQKDEPGQHPFAQLQQLLQAKEQS